MNRETSLLRTILLHVCNGSTRLFRNNVGVAKFPDGTVVKYGLCTGSSDLIGWKTVTITPEMVGKRIAIFTAIEVKAGTRASKEQLNFIQQVQASGGIAAIARSPDEARNIIETHIPT
jgi:hypothetical protein